MGVKAKRMKKVVAPAKPVATTAQQESERLFPVGSHILVHGRIAQVGDVQAWMDPMEGKVQSHSVQGHISLLTECGVRSVRIVDVVKDGERQRKNPPSGFKEENMASNAKARKEKVAKVRSVRTWADGSKVPGSATSEFLDRAVKELEKGNILFPAKSKRGGRILVRFIAKWLARLADAKKVAPTEEWVKEQAVKAFKAESDHPGFKWIAQGLEETPAYWPAVVKQTRKFSEAKDAPAKKADAPAPAKKGTAKAKAPAKGKKDPKPAAKPEKVPAPKAKKPKGKKKNPALRAPWGSEVVDKDAGAVPPASVDAPVDPPAVADEDAGNTGDEAQGDGN